MFITDGEKHLNFVDDGRNEYWLYKNLKDFKLVFSFDLFSDLLFHTQYGHKNLYRNVLRKCETLMRKKINTIIYTTFIDCLIKHDVLFWPSQLICQN